MFLPVCFKVLDVRENLVALFTLEESIRLSMPLEMNGEAFLVLEPAWTDLALKRTTLCMDLHVIV